MPLLDTYPPATLLCLGLAMAQACSSATAHRKETPALQVFYTHFFNAFFLFSFEKPKKDIKKMDGLKKKKKNE
jgi:hypothetical protein